MDESEREGRFDLRAFWHLVVDKIWIVILCAVVGVGLSLVYLARTPKLYQGHIVLEVAFQEPSVGATGTATRSLIPFLASDAALHTIEQKLVNSELMARVIRTERLADDGGQSFLGRNVSSIGSKSPSAAANAGPASTPTPMGPPIFTPLEQALGGALAGMVQPVIRKGTRLIDVYVKHHDPALAQRLANAVGREYIRYDIQHRSISTEETLRYLMGEEERLRNNLQKNGASLLVNQAGLANALQSSGATGIGTQTQPSASGGATPANPNDLSTDLASLKAERMRLEMEQTQIERVADNVKGLLAIPGIAAAPEVAARRQEVAQAETNVAALAQRYKNKHPKMMAAQAALAQAQDALRLAVLAEPSVRRNVLEQARAAEGQIDTSTQAQVQTDRAMYESVLRQIKDLDLAKDVQTNAASVIQQSGFPNQPVSPKPLLAVGLGLGGGLAIGLALVFALATLDRSIKTVDQAETILGLPCLAAIPETSKDEIARPGGDDHAEALRDKLVVGAPEGPVAEAFRNLRAALSLLGPETERKVFLFTSALPAEGKSFTSANYALALMQQGYRVLLIDGDLRRPTLHKIFAQTRGATATKNGSDFGVADCLISAVSLKDAIKLVATDEDPVLPDGAVEPKPVSGTMGGQLSLLGGGRRAPNPAELLSGALFGNLVAEASLLFDRIVIDSAPILAVSDTLLMTPHIHTICLVLRAAKTPRNAVHRALSMLAGVSGPPAGLILNRLPHRRGAGYYYYYAAHGYGAGEGSYGGRYGDRYAKKVESKNGEIENR